jgi:transposase
MRLFVGLDVSLAKIAICVVSEHGKIVKEAQVASEPEVLVSWIGEQNGSIAAIGLEAGPLSQWLHRGLTEAGSGRRFDGNSAGQGRLEGYADQD